MLSFTFVNPMQLDGVDVEWVRDTLNKFVSETKPLDRSYSATITRAPQCGHDQALEMAETVYPILDSLYPDWKSENPENQFDEFFAEREASKRLLARLKSQDEVRAKLGSDVSPKLAAAGMHPLIWKAAQAQWSTGHRHEAVLAAAKVVNSHLQTKVGRRDVSEADLVRQAFSDKAPEHGKARLRFTAIADEKTRESMRQGVMDFGAGCFSAIRNPLGHRPNEEVELDDQTALERLAALSLLTRWIDEANLVRIGQ